MDQRYFEFLGRGIFYTPNDSNDSKQFVIPIPANWISAADEHWVSLTPEGKEIPEQGWKIHISSTVNEAQTCIQQVSTKLISLQVPFKFVRGALEYMQKNAKYGPRPASGKLITVYPKSTEQFLTLLPILEYVTKEFLPGPYILSDRRWNDSNVYYRYGAFKKIEFDENGETKLGIRDPSGKIHEDVRKPIYHVPDWVAIPPKLADQEAFQDISVPSRLDDYDKIEALHFSNGGGVYKAVKITDGQTIVLKEGRPNAGLDGHGRDAVTRVEHESLVLQQLYGVATVPKWVDEFPAWEHRFLVMEYVKGDTLSELIAKKYPFQRGSDVESYVSMMVSIAQSAINAIKSIHGRGIAHGDLQPQNLIVQDHSGSLRARLIDFEVAGSLNRPGASTLATPGYIDKIDDPLGRRDWFALFRMMRYAFLPIGALEDHSLEQLKVMRDWIKKEMGSSADDVLQQICDAAKEEGYDLSDNKHNPVRSSLSSSAHIIELKPGYIAPADLVPPLARFIEKNADPEKPRLAPGDIRQWSKEGGAYSVAYGGAGIAMALVRSGQNCELAKEWASRRTYDELSILPLGLFNGQAGVATVLAECDQLDVANKLFSQIAKADLSKIRSVNLDSGLAGVGLSLLRAADHFENSAYRSAALRYARELINRINGFANKSERHPRLEETDTTPTGLLYGWSGVAYFLMQFKDDPQAQDVYDYGVKLASVELVNCYSAEGMFLIKAPDQRLLPYLSMGSVGLLPTLALLDIDKKQQMISGIAEATMARPCAHFGLFKGFVGLLWGADFIDKTGLLVHDSSCFDKAYTSLPLYLLSNEALPVTPGDFMYRMSCDLATGASGLLAVLSALKCSQISWLPVLL